MAQVLASLASLSTLDELYGQKQNLGEIVQKAKHQEFRDEVAKEETWTGISHALNVALSNPIDDKRVIEILQEIFKVIRNLCAFSPANQSLSLSSGIHLKLSQLFTAYKTYLHASHDDPSNEVTTTLHLSLQTLNNLIAGNAETQEIIWNQYFINSKTLLQLFETCDPKGRQFLAFVLFVLIHSSPERSRQLVQDMQLINFLLIQADDEDELDETLNMMVNIFSKLFHFGLSSSLLSNLWENKNLTSAELRSFMHFFQKKCQDDQSIDEDSNDDDDFENLSWIDEKTYEILTQILQALDLGRMITEFPTNKGEVIIKIELLVALLNTFVSLTRFYDKTISSMFLKHGLVKALIELLRSASPLKPATPKKQEDLAGDIRTFLRGFKSNIVKIFGNLSYRNREIQDELRKEGGLILVLNHCHIDDTNPYLREWSVVTLRNLCESNLENQEFIHSLKPEGTGENEILAEVGFDLTLENGKPRLQKKENSK